MTKFAVAGAAALALSACDPRIFDDLADEAPVHSHTEPGGLDSSFYGDRVAGGGVLTQSGAAFFVLARNQDGFGQVRVDRDGAVDVVGISASELEPGGELDPFDATFAMFPDPASANIGVGLSIDGGSGHVVQLIDVAENSQSGPFPFSGGAVTGIGFGVTNADPASQGDIAIAGGSSLGVIADIDGSRTASVCTLDRTQAARAIIADLHSGVAGSEIAVSSGEGDLASGQSQVDIVDGATVVAGAAAGPCFDAGVPRQALLTLTESEPDFGAEMITGDFNGNGVSDLAVSAPSAQKVYVYLDVDLASGAPTATEVTGDTSSFGNALAAGDLNGDGADELVVGEPDADADGVTLAGSAHIFELDGSAFGAPLTVHDASPETDQRFGLSVAIVPFGDAEEILVVGADREVFTYFRTPVDGDADVRAQ